MLLEIDGKLLMAECLKPSDKINASKDKKERRKNKKLTDHTLCAAALTSI